MPNSGEKANPLKSHRPQKLSMGLSIVTVADQGSLAMAKFPGKRLSVHQLPIGMMNPMATILGEIAIHELDVSCQNRRLRDPTIRRRRHSTSCVGQARGVRPV